MIDPEPTFSTRPACYLCGSSDRLTKEHVPARGLFPKPRPSNLRTIPCCEICNNSASQDDEYFRLAVSAPINRNVFAAKSWQRVAESTLPKRRIGRLIDELCGTVRPGLLITSLGRIPASQIGVRADVISRVLVRITKGFLYLTHPEIDRSNLDFHLTQIHQFKLDSLYTRELQTNLLIIVLETACIDTGERSALRRTALACGFICFTMPRLG